MSLLCWSCLQLTQIDKARMGKKKRREDKKIFDLISFQFLLQINLWSICCVQSQQYSIRCKLLVKHQDYTYFITSVVSSYFYEQRIGYLICVIPNVAPYNAAYVCKRSSDCHVNMFLNIYSLFFRHYCVLLFAGKPCLQQWRYWKKSCFGPQKTATLVDNVL